MCVRDISRQGVCTNASSSVRLLLQVHYLSLCVCIKHVIISTKYVQSRLLGMILLTVDSFADVWPENKRIGPVKTVTWLITSPDYS